tara:strand:+ start:128 stop:616 length:489 start_codon:yes stop_codon:yes gene_type:complete
MKSAQGIPCKARHILGSRKVKAVELRRSGMTYKQVGEALGVGPCRARQIVVNSEWKLRLVEEGKDKKRIAVLELGVRACNVLCNARIAADRASVREAIEDGRLNPRPNGLRNFGWKTYTELCKYAGLENPNLQRKKMRIDTLRNEIRNIEKEIEHYKEIASR